MILANGISGVTEEFVARRCLSYGVRGVGGVEAVHD